MFQATFYVKPVPKARQRFTKSGFCYMPKETKEAEKLLRLWFMRINRVLPEKDAPIAIAITLYKQRPKSSKRKYPTVKPDVDNYAKLFMDAGNRYLWVDDCQITDLSVKKRYGVPERIEFKMQEIE